MLRLFKINAWIKSSEQNVKDELQKLGMEMLITVIISTVLFMIIENFNINNEDDMLIERYDFYVTLYFIFVTVSTVGYGDFFPITPPGRAFIAGLILYIIVYRLPISITKITDLMARNSPYQRQTYKSTSEVPHIVISGQVIVQALKNFTTELFHQDHGS